MDYTLVLELAGTAVGAAALVGGAMASRYGKQQTQQATERTKLESANTQLTQQVAQAKTQTTTLTEAMALAKDAVMGLEQ
ncbi:MAG: hypothetical protein ACFB14_18240, partial [Leptolyngbyaceae cyanobacterium]